MIRRGRRAAFRHPWPIVAVAAVAGLASWFVAAHQPVPGWELALTVWANRWPAALATALVPVMQVGTLAAPIVAGLVVLVIRRDVPVAVVLVAGGWLTWTGAKVIKDAVERGRPAVYRGDIVVREPSAHGYGYISGHSAVSMFTMVVVAGLLPPRWRPALVGVAAVVGWARLVHGVHLPADVVGGWAFGALVAVGLLAITGVDSTDEPAEPAGLVDVDPSGPVR